VTAAIGENTLVCEAKTARMVTRPEATVAMSKHVIILWFRAQCLLIL